MKNLKPWNRVLPFYNPFTPLKTLTPYPFPFARVIVPSLCLLCIMSKTKNVDFFSVDLQVGASEGSYSKYVSGDGYVLMYIALNSLDDDQYSTYEWVRMGFFSQQKQQRRDNNDGIQTTVYQAGWTLRDIKIQGINRIEWEYVSYSMLK